LKEKSLYSFPLSIHFPEEKIKLRYLIEQKTRWLKGSISKLVIKICQRNLLKREFMNRNKAIDVTQDFCRATKAYSTVQQEGVIEECPKFDVIQCTKCRGVSSMCGKLSKANDSPNRLPNVQYSRSGNHQSIQDNEQCIIMRGDYCRFCNHHARDHVISEQSEFELVDEER